MRRFLCACIWACSMWAAAHAQPACVPQEDIATHGVRLGDSEADVRRLLGQPRKVTTGTSEDDGGEYPIRFLTYESLVVTMGRDRVESIEITGPRHPVAAGLFIGRSPAGLQSKSLIDNSDLAEGATLGIRFCGAEMLPIAGLSIFVVDDRVTKAELFTYGP